MHAIIRSAFVATAAVFLVPNAAMSQPATAPSQLNGTWKLDPAASKFTSGPAIRSETRTYQVTGNRVRLISNGIDASGKPAKYSYTASYDGKYYPMVGNPRGDSIALKRINARVVEATVKMAGYISAYAKVTVSADGKRLALTRRIIGTKGKPAIDELIYVKQR